MMRRAEIRATLRASSMRLPLGLGEKLRLVWRLRLRLSSRARVPPATQRHPQRLVTEP